MKTAVSVILQFCTLFLVWLILSAHYELPYIIIGAGCSALVTFFTNELAFSTAAFNKKETLLPSFSEFWRFLVLYFPKLIFRIVLANLQVAYFVLHPKIPINPGFLQFQTKFHRSIAQVILANSITLTPGTITLELKDGFYTVHSLVPICAGDLVTAKMQNDVGAIFGEEKEMPLDEKTSWCFSVDEVAK